jgi:hypothetical protein
MAKLTPRSRRAKNPMSREAGIEASATIGITRPKGTLWSCRKFSRTTPIPIWASVARLISPIHDTTDADSTASATISPKSMA